MRLFLTETRVGQYENFNATDIRLLWYGCLNDLELEEIKDMCVKIVVN